MSSYSSLYFSSLTSLATSVNFIPWLETKDSLYSLSVRCDTELKVFLCTGVLEDLEP